MTDIAGIVPVPPASRRISSWLGLIACAGMLSAACTGPAHRQAAVSTVVIEPVAGASAPDPNVFRLAGRASVDSEDGDFSGGVQWHHAGAGDEILLLSPLGQAVARIRQDSAGVSLTTASDETFHAPDAETLTQEVLGWRLPLAGLLYWVQGVHAPVSAAEVDSDAQGTVVAIRQDGWEIDYMRYFPAAEAQDGKARLSSARPKLLVLRRPGLRMKLVIDSWDAGER